MAVFGAGIRGGCWARHLVRSGFAASPKWKATLRTPHSPWHRSVSLKREVPGFAYWARIGPRLLPVPGGSSTRSKNGSSKRSGPASMVARAWRRRRCAGADGATLCGSGLRQKPHFGARQAVRPAHSACRNKGFSRGSESRGPGLLGAATTAGGMAGIRWRRCLCEGQVGPTASASRGMRHEGHGWRTPRERRLDSIAARAQTRTRTAPVIGYVFERGAFSRGLTISTTNRRATRLTGLAGQFEMGIGREQVVAGFWGLGVLPNRIPMVSLKQAAGRGRGDDDVVPPLLGPAPRAIHIAPPTPHLRGPVSGRRSSSPANPYRDEIAAADRRRPRSPLRCVL